MIINLRELLEKANNSNNENFERLREEFIEEMRGEIEFKILEIWQEYQLNRQEERLEMN